MKRIKLKPQQENAVQRRLAEPTQAALDPSDTGAGKTVMAVELALRLGVQQALVICPVGKPVKSWTQTFERQGWKHPVYPIDSKHLENHARLTSGEPGAYIVGREFFYISATASQPKFDKAGNITNNPRKAKWSWAKAKPGIVVLDESHRAANRYGLLYETLKTLPKHGYRLAMSGTPQGSHFDGIWAPTRWLWPEVVDRSKNRWMAQWCETTEVVVGRDKTTGELKRVMQVVGERNPGEYINWLPCAIKVSVEKKPYEEYDVEVELSAQHQAIWNEMNKKSIAWLQDNPTVAKLPVEKRIRLRQIALAVPIVSEEGEVDFAEDAESPKLRVAEKIKARHPGQPILYVTDSAKFATIAAKRLGAKLLKGGLSTKRKQELVDGFGVDYQYLVGTYGAIAEATDGLQNNCSVEVLFNPPDGSVAAEQFAGRLNRIGQDADFITRYRLIAKNTLDDEHFVKNVLAVETRRKEVIVNDW